MKNTTTKSKRVRVSTREFGEGSYGIRYIGRGPWTRVFKQMNEDWIYCRDIGKDTEWKLIEVHNKNGILISSLLYQLEPHGKWNCCGPFEYLMEEQFFIDIVSLLKS